MTPSQLTYFKFFVRTNEPANRKVVCEPPDGNLPTLVVDIDRINRAAAGVRQALARFVGQCLDDQNGGVARSGAHLKELAENGNKLYWALFDDRANSDNAQQVREWILEAAGTHRMHVVIDDRTYVPWGLVYDDDPSKLSGDPEDVDIALYKNFWSLKYFVSPFYKNVIVRAGVNPKPVALYRLVSALHQSAFSGAEALFDVTDSEKQILDWLRQHFDVTKAFNAVYNKTDLFELWNTHSDLDMIFFYCHANETSIAFSTTDMLTIDEISEFQQKKEQLSWAPGRVGCLFFMNGCATAVGSENGGFLEITGRKSACGFIGTEAEIPDLFALRFGLAFLYHFLGEGRPVYEVMALLRRDHWPLSILYTTYCSPGLRVEPRKGISLTFKNFSQQRLGTTSKSVI
jgi:hypothetical protein